MKRILVTNVQTAADEVLVHQLATAGYAVRIIASNVNAGNALLQLPVEIFPGSIYDTETIVSAAKGCEMVINTSIDTSSRAFKINSKQTMAAIMDAVLKTQVTRVMHVLCCHITEQDYVVVPGYNNDRIQEILPVGGGLQQCLDIVDDKKYKGIHNTLLVLNGCCSASYSNSAGIKNLLRGFELPGRLFNGGGMCNRVILLPFATEPVEKQRLSILYRGEAFLKMLDL